LALFRLGSGPELLLQHLGTFGNGGKGFVHRLSPSHWNG
jgi:hypothetical protein